MSRESQRELLNGDSSVDPFVSDSLRLLREAGSLDMAALLPIRQYLAGGQKGCPCELYERLGNRVLKLGEPLLAYDVLANGLEQWPGNVRLRQLLALALARSGATGRANRMLHQLHAAGEKDTETLGILARTHKDLWERSRAQDEDLRKAHDIYREAYTLAASEDRADDIVYAGINAASTALLLGQVDLAREIAGEVRDKCSLKLQEGDDYWAAATLGEASVVLDQPEEAEKWYLKASKMGRGNYGDLSSTRRNARLLAGHLWNDEHRFDQCFNVPTILVFSNRSAIDAHRFSAFSSDADERAAGERIKEALLPHTDKIGYSGAMSAADIVFLETVLEQGGEINVVLPVSPEVFARTIEASVPGSRWKERFDMITSWAARVVVAGEHRVPSSGVAREYTTGMLEGIARLRARMLDTDVVPVAFEEETEVSATAVPDREPEDMPEFPRKIMVMLFADVQGYSKLTEEQIPRFATHFMGAVAELMAECDPGPVVKNSWGDALYLVFGGIEEAGGFALDMRDRLSGIDWERKGLPKDLNIRIALHAGPVYGCKDPVTAQDNFIGWHVNRVARTEPITPPGHVYASEGFAALAAARDVTAFACDYVGETTLAKGFGTFPTYHVRRT